MDNMSGVYNKCGERRGAHRDLMRCEERITLGKPMPGGRIILMWILKITLEDVDCIDVAQDRDRWRAVFNTAVNFKFP
jgi:hypothetical protein